MSKLSVYYDALHDSLETASLTEPEARLFG